MQKIRPKIAGEFTSNSMGFYKTFENKEITERDLVLFMLKCISSKDWAIIAATSILAVFSGIILPWANSFIFGDLIPAGQTSGILPAAALIFSVVSIAAIFRLFQSLILTNTMLRMSTYVQSGIFSRLLSLRPDFFTRVKSGELSSRIMEFADLSSIVSARSISALISLILSFVYLIQIYIYAYELFAWLILITVIFAILILLEAIQASAWQKEYSRSLADMAGFCYEMFAGIEQIKLNGAEARTMKRWSEKYLHTSRCEDKPLLLKYSPALYKLISLLATGWIFLYGSRLSPSQYIAFSVVYGAYIGSIMGTYQVVKTISTFRSSYSLIRPLLYGECEQYGGGKIGVKALDGNIVISDLYFAYDKKGPYILKGLSLDIKKGESIGIVGRSGCGKSTLIRLLLGFEDADDGSIYIDGFDIRELDLKDYRRKIGTVLQGASLIAGDIYSNITITKPDATMEEVEDAIYMAGLDKDIASLPMGLHTPISEENSTLSGGQRQRILIARAIISKPSILIFDEATSALDNIGQARVTASINSLNCTKIIVAHRLITIEKCDKILVMDGGQIVEAGTYEDLLERGEVFADLVVNQKIT